MATEKERLMFKKIKQYLKSFTINFGLLLQIAAALQFYYQDIGDPFATMVVGLIVIGLRFKTNSSLADK